MTLRQFLKLYKHDIDAIAVRQGAPKPSNNVEREDWVRNEETLYLLACRSIKNFE